MAEPVYPHAVAAKLAEHIPGIPLTPRETEVLSLVAKGPGNAEVGARIGRTEAVTTALRRDFIRLE